MERTSIMVLYAEDNGKKEAVMGVPSGTKYDKSAIEKSIFDFLINKHMPIKNDKRLKDLATVISLGMRVGDYGYTFFFEELPFFVKETPRKKDKLDDVVTVTCYNQTEKQTRREAMSFYFEAMCCSEGAEHDRYETIFFQLMQGAMTASDHIDFRGF